jgi:hypothetical protein
VLIPVPPTHHALRHSDDEVGARARHHERKATERSVARGSHDEIDIRDAVGRHVDSRPSLAWLQGRSIVVLGFDTVVGGSQHRVDRVWLVVDDRGVPGRGIDVAAAETEHHNSGTYCGERGRVMQRQGSNAPDHGTDRIGAQARFLNVGQASDISPDADESLDGNERPMSPFARRLWGTAASATVLIAFGLLAGFHAYLILSAVLFFGAFVWLVWVVLTFFYSVWKGFRG